MILKAAILVIYLGAISLVIFGSSITSGLGQSGCGPGTTLVPATNECVPATVKCGAGTILNTATNQCDLATTPQTAQANMTTPQTAQANMTTPQTAQANATDTGIVSNDTAGTTTTGGASNQCKGDDVSLGNLCIPRSCTLLLNTFAMNLRDLTQDQVYKQCADEGLISK